MSRQNKNTTSNQPLTAEQIRAAPISVLLNQKKIIPTHQQDLHFAVDQAMMAISHQYNTKAQALGCLQLTTSDGMPIVGAVYPQSSLRPKNFVKKHMGKKVVCHMPCCTMYHPHSQDTTLGQADYSFGKREYLPQTGWIKVESRSKRNKRLKATREQQLENQYLYNREDNDDALSCYSN